MRGHTRKAKIVFSEARTEPRTKRKSNRDYSVHHARDDGDHHFHHDDLFFDFLFNAIAF